MRRSCFLHPHGQNTCWSAQILNHDFVGLVDDPLVGCGSCRFLAVSPRWHTQMKASRHEKVMFSASTWTECMLECSNFESRLCGTRGRPLGVHDIFCTRWENFNHLPPCPAMGTNQKSVCFSCAVHFAILHDIFCARW